MSPWLLLLLLAGVLQSSLLSELSYFGVHPNLVLVLVVGWTLLRSGREGLIWGLVGGILLDLYSSAPFGVFTIAMLIVAFVVSFAEALPFHTTLLLSLGIVFLMSLLLNIVAMVMMQSLGWDVAWGSLSARLPPAALLDTLLLLLLYRPLRVLSRLAGARAIEWGTPR